MVSNNPTLITQLINSDHSKWEQVWESNASLIKCVWNWNVQNSSRHCTLKPFRLNSAKKKLSPFTGKNCNYLVWYSHHVLNEYPVFIFLGIWEFATRVSLSIWYLFNYFITLRFTILNKTRWDYLQRRSKYRAYEYQKHSKSRQFSVPYSKGSLLLCLHSLMQHVVLLMISPWI